MKKEVIRVLHIIPGYGGGISSYVRNIVSSINSNKVIIDVVGFSDYSNDFRTQIENKGGKVYTLPRIGKDGLFKVISAYINIISNENQYNMVHCHFSGYRALFFSLLSKLCGVKRVAVHAHRSDDEYKDRFSNIKLLVERIMSCILADNLVSCSEIASKYIFGEKYVHQNMIMHLPNSIPVEKYCIKLSDVEKSVIKDGLDIKSNKLIIGHIGRFNIQKNHLFMVKLIKRMKERNLDFVWLFIGDGQEFNSIKNLINNNDCNEYVRFLGRREDVHILYSIIDVMVLPSFFEGLPTVVVEAQAAGVPSIISTNVTDEVDMKMNILKSLSLDENLDIWIDSIISMSNIQVPEKDDRIKCLEERNFTSKSAAQLYEDFVYERVLANTLK